MLLNAFLLFVTVFLLALASESPSSSSPGTASTFLRQEGSASTNGSDTKTVQAQGEPASATGILLLSPSDLITAFNQSLSRMEAVAQAVAAAANILAPPQNMAQNHGLRTCGMGLSLCLRTGTEWSSWWGLGAMGMMHGPELHKLELQALAAGCRHGCRPSAG